MSTNRKVWIRYRSGRMREVIYSVLPDGCAFRCKGIAKPAVRISSASCSTDFYSSPSPRIQVSLASCYVAHRHTKIAKTTAHIRITRIRVDVKSVVDQIQDFRGSELDKAKRWWCRNKADLIDLLPLTWKGITYTTRFPEKFEEWLYNDKLNPMLTEIYVFRRLYKVQQAMHAFLSH